MKLWLYLALPLYVLDQLTKQVVLRQIPFETSVPVIPGVFNLVHVGNTGAAFGMFKDANLFFLLLSSAALVVLAVLTVRRSFRDRLSRVAAALLAAGVAGNLTDRLLHGHVIDFIDIILPWYGHWPAFNVADSCICVAAGLFVLASFMTQPKSAQP